MPGPESLFGLKPLKSCITYENDPWKYGGCDHINDIVGITRSEATVFDLASIACEDLTAADHPQLFPSVETLEARLSTTSVLD